MKKIIAVLFFLPVFACMAGSPASTAYVDAAAANLQTQINDLNALPSVAHPIGSCFGGGVVIYTNSTPGAPAGQRGLIAKLSDSTTGCFGADGTCTWASNVPSNFGTSPGYFEGQANTSLIQSSLSNTQAANAAYDTTPAPDCPTCTNWYLPSQYELYIIYAQNGLNGSTLWTNCGGTPPTTSITPDYWSSTQDILISNRAFNVNMSTGNASFSPVASTLRVRAVRAF